MNRGVMIYASLLVVALLAAYFSWTHEADDRRSTGVVLVDLDESELGEVTYVEGSEFRVSLTPRSDDYGSYVWISTRREKPEKGKESDAHHGHDHDDVKSGASKVEELTFKGGTNVQPMMAKLTPFMAIRKIEDVEGRLEEFGLDAPKATLALAPKGGDARTFDVGKEGYGHRNIYVRDTADGAIYLVSGSAIRPLKNADTRLPERRLVDLKPSEILAATVHSDKASRTFEQKNRDDRQKAFWTVEGAEERNRSAEAWVEKLLRMRSLSYVAADAVGDLEPRLTIDFKADGRQVQVELLHGEDAEGREQWYGKSPLTRGLVMLPLVLAADLAQDVSTIMGNEAPEGAAPTLEK